MDEEIHDFFNDKEIQPLQNIQLEYDEDIEACVNILTPEFSLQPAPCPCIESFLLYKSYQSPGVVETYKSTSGIFDIAIYQVQHARPLGRVRNFAYEWHRCFLALLSLNKDYPRTCIFKETMQTRINDWFTKQDVDFEERKEFSRQFYVVSSDKVKLQSLLYNRPLNDLAIFPEMEAEIRGKYCLFKVSNDHASAYAAMRLVELANKLHKILS